MFPEMPYLVNYTFGLLDKQQFEQTLDAAAHMVAYESEQLSSDDKTVLMQFGYFLLASAEAGLGHTERAIDYLHQAVDHGWNNMNEMMACDPLTPLHGTEAWNKIIARINSQSTTTTNG